MALLTCHCIGLRNSKTLSLMPEVWKLSALMSIIELNKLHVLNLGVSLGTADKNGTAQFGDRFCRKDVVTGETVCPHTWTMAYAHVACGSGTLRGNHRPCPARDFFIHMDWSIIHHSDLKFHIIIMNWSRNFIYLTKLVIFFQIFYKSPLPEISVFNNEEMHRAQTKKANTTGSRKFLLGQAATKVFFFLSRQRRGIPMAKGLRNKRA